MKRTLYKYISVDSVEGVGRLKRLFDGWLYFSSPLQFNDPFELSPVEVPPKPADFEEIVDSVGFDASLVTPSGRKRIYRALADQITHASRPAVSLEWQRSLGVLCLSAKFDDLLMWAHYAKNHTGICVGFDSGVAPFNGAKEVEYSHERPALRRMDLSATDEERVRQVLLTKSSHWGYESEWRCIKRPISGDEREFYRRICAERPDAIEEVAAILSSEGGPGMYEFDHLAIRRVYFGARIDVSVRDSIICMLGEGNLRAKMFQMHLDARYYALRPEKLR